MPDYGNVDYWNDRYTKDNVNTFEWLENWKDLKEGIEKFATKGLYTDQSAAMLTSSMSSSSMGSYFTKNYQPIGNISKKKYEAMPVKEEI